MLRALQPPPPRSPRSEAPLRPARRRRAMRGAPGRLLLVAASLLGPLVPGARGEDSSPFRIHLHDVRGRIVQAWPLAVSACDDGSGDLLILSSEGGPPDQMRFATWMPCGSALVPGDPRIVVRKISEAAVAVDVSPVPGRPGPQLLSVSAAGLRIESLAGDPQPIGPADSRWPAAAAAALGDRKASAGRRLERRRQARGPRAGVDGRLARRAPGWGRPADRDADLRELRELHALPAGDGLEMAGAGGELADAGPRGRRRGRPARSLRVVALGHLDLPRGPGGPAVDALAQARLRPLRREGGAPPRGERPQLLRPATSTAIPAPIWS